MKDSILLVGGGGHCKVVLDTLLSLDLYKRIGIIEKQENIGKSVLDVPIVGLDEDLADLFKNGYSHAFVSVGSVGNTSIRRSLHSKLLSIGFIIPNIVDKTAHVSKYINLGQGNYIGKNASVNAGSIIGNCTIINTSCTIEHDCNIGDFAHISPSAVLCGGVTIGSNSHIGATSVVKQNVNIGQDTIIGIGSVAIKNIEDGVIAYGCPCKTIEQKDRDK